MLLYSIIYQKFKIFSYSEKSFGEQKSLQNIKFVEFFIFSRLRI